ncbi:helix-turn-helix domain-containing protein [Azospirillum canadense]|uniref:helix-turn-helix domain-containing protein n=1 Tax=Azospirillum canadense TaxID=403962 RepID=UPI0022260D07|nr:helix-turn-helix domain-containing protein [Azospirillum canadense]MCW2239539.1 biotin operon repressor [Azospirillum canadense]
MPTASVADLPDTGRWGRIPSWWLEHPDLDADGFAVLAALATFADETGLCWPSQSTLAAKLKRSRPTINRILQGLSNIGLVSIEHRRGRDGARLSCLYRLRFVPEGEGEEPAATASGLRRAADRDDSATNAPCPPPSQKQVHPKQIPDSLASCAQAPVRTVPVDWMPTADDMAWARVRHTDIDLSRHVEAFVLRCQAHGYRYRDVSAAWRAWLAQDVAAGKAPVLRNTSATDTPAGQPRRARDSAAQRVDAWAATAAELRQRAATPSPWS